MTFSIDSFASGLKSAMAAASHDDINARQTAAAAYYRSTLEKHTTDEILTVLQSSIPPGASIGEMIIHSSPELTMLYGRIPPKFMSAVHDHTIFACIGTLVGREINTIYKLGDTKETPPTIEREFTVEAGQVVELPADVVHSIANPDDTFGHALHIYGGDFHAVMNERTLWTADELKEIDFSFPGVMKESAKRMKIEGNDAGLDALVAAVPKMKPVVDAIRGTDAPEMEPGQ